MTSPTLPLTLPTAKLALKALRQQRALLEGISYSMPIPATYYDELTAAISELEAAVGKASEK